MRNSVDRSIRTWAALVVALALLAAPPAVRQVNAQEVGPPQEQDRVITVKILGMSCPFCVYGAEQKLKKLNGVDSLRVDLESGLARLTMQEHADVSNQQLRTTVESAGFEAAAIIRNFESDYKDWHPEAMPDSVTGPDSAAVRALWGANGRAPWGHRGEVHRRAAVSRPGGAPARPVLSGRPGGGLHRPLRPGAQVRAHGHRGELRGGSPDCAPRGRRPGGHGADGDGDRLRAGLRTGRPATGEQR